LYQLTEKDGKVPYNSKFGFCAVPQTICKMTVETDIENLGVPDVEIGGLQIWTHSRKYPEHENFWDVNWLNSTFHCRAQGAAVWISGDILHNTEIAEWLVALEDLNSTLSGEAILPTLERYVNLSPD
jgi:hypothetical protein